jgi:restriction endonuclease S subunit
MSQNWRPVPVREILQLQRRWINLEPDQKYREIGLRSFGKGVFHKPPVSGLSLGNKRVLEIHPGDIVFSNVFSWEGAVAVAGPQEQGMIGSHRFVTYTVDPTISTAEFLKLFFATHDGLTLLRKVSPGSAGRNRTLSLEGFASQSIPLPSLEEQRRIVARVETLAAKSKKPEDCSKLSKK